MNYFISIITGALIVAISIMIINREMNKSIEFRNIKIDNIANFDKKELLKLFDNIDVTINEINNAFYEISNDLEGKYSIHDKEIEMLNETIKIMSDKINSLENKELDTEKAETTSIVDFSAEELSTKVVEVGEFYEEKEKSDSNSDDIYFNVEKLKNSGYSNGQIAKKLNIGIGEVNLIINMK